MGRDQLIDLVWVAVMVKPAHKGRIDKIDRFMSAGDIQPL